MLTSPTCPGAPARGPAREDLTRCPVAPGCARLRHARFDSPLGPILAIASDVALLRVGFADELEAPAVLPAPRARRGRSRLGLDHPVLERTRRELEEYFAGGRPGFDLPLAPAGSPFQRRVWGCLMGIPHARVRTYADVARVLGRPRAVRAVARAIGANPIAIIVPCHRVIGADGSLRGYAWGVDRKRGLLEHEGGAVRCARTWST